MASPTIKRGKQHTPNKSIFLATLSFFPRRCAAWAIELYLVAMSGFIPYGIGAYIESHSQDTKVPLNSVLADVEEVFAQTLALPRRQTPLQVPPLTNLFWGLALVTPLALTGWQVFLLAKIGRTLPKRWLGIRVVNTNGKAPGLGRIILREGVGKWGLPLGIAYVLWCYSPVFPGLGWLLGLGGVMVMLEGSLVWMPSRRPFHDLIAGTVVIDTTKKNYRPHSPSTQVEIQTTSLTVTKKHKKRPQSDEVVRAIVVHSPIDEPKLNLWSWMRQHPGVTLLIIAFAGMTVILGTFVGTQVYIQSKTDQRETEQQKNEAFLNLVNQLGSTSTDPLQERKTTILALGRLDDPRAVPLLVDLIGQETNPSLLDTLEQAIISTGVKSIPALRQLNQSLSNQVQSLPQGSQEQQLTLKRLLLTQQAIAKLLLLNSGQLSGSNLTKADLGKDTTGFTLVLGGIDLAGINLKGAKLNEADLRESRFSSGGKDKHFDTFDDVVADLSDSNLVRADLSEANLSHVLLNKANLMQANFKKANLSQAQLNSTNLSSAQFVEANLQEANLEKASLTGANLSQAQVNQANLKGANLGRVNGTGAIFSQANLTQSNWQDSNLSGANFTNANLQQADLSSTLLKGANFNNAQLQNANLAYANLAQANLQGANLTGANFAGVVFTLPKLSRNDGFLTAPSIDQSGANIRGVDFTNVKNLSPSQIEFICHQGGIHPQCQ